MDNLRSALRKAELERKNAQALQYEIIADILNQDKIERSVELQKDIELAINSWEKSLDEDLFLFTELTNFMSKEFYQVSPYHGPPSKDFRGTCKKVMEKFCDHVFYIRRKEDEVLEGMTFSKKN